MSSLAALPHSGDFQHLPFATGSNEQSHRHPSQYLWKGWPPPHCSGSAPTRGVCPHPWGVLISLGCAHIIGVCPHCWGVPTSLGCAHISGMCPLPSPAQDSCSPGLSTFIQLSHAPAQNHLLFQEEIAFHAPGNLSAVFALGDFKWTSAYY